jgi:hypothetical protein
MMLSGSKRHAQQRRETPESSTPAAQGLIEGTGLRLGCYHDQSVTVPLSSAEMKDMVEIGNLFASTTGRLAKNASILRFALAQLAKRINAGVAERELVVQDFIASLCEVTAARREHREQKRLQALAEGEN